MWRTHGSSRLSIVAAAAAIGLSASVGATEEPRLTIPGETPPTPQVEPLSDEQVRADLRRLTTMKIQCSTQARQALAAQQNASAVGRTAEAEAQGHILWTRMRCVEQANQALLQLRDHVTRDQLRFFSAEDAFHQEYRQGLQAHLAILQRLSEQLADQSALTAETFGKQMAAYRQQREAFKNRYIRLLKDPETQPFATTLFQAGDLLIGSAQVWARQAKAEADITELTARGPSPQLAQAQTAREAAVTERARQLETAQGLIRQAAALAAMR